MRKLRGIDVVLDEYTVTGQVGQDVAGSDGTTNTGQNWIEEFDRKTWTMRED